jgi:hypothetical protein
VAEVVLLVQEQELLVLQVGQVAVVVDMLQEHQHLDLEHKHLLED